MRSALGHGCPICWHLLTSRAMISRSLGAVCCKNKVGRRFPSVLHDASSSIWVKAKLRVRDLVATLSLFWLLSPSPLATR